MLRFWADLYERYSEKNCLASEKLLNMYGQIHLILKELVEEQYGHPEWTKILNQCKWNDEDNFLTFHYYNDNATVTLLNAIANVLKLHMDEVLKMFGGHFLTYCMKHGYDKMLTTLGGDLISFVENLDSLHSLLSFTYSDIVPPSFRCVQENNGSLTLHYYSVRDGLASMVVGILQAVGREFFHQSVKLTVVGQGLEDVGLEPKLHHTLFSVEIKDLEAQDSESRVYSIHRRSQRCSHPSFEEQSTESRLAFHHQVAEDFNAAFPYHILLDRFMFIRECGINIQRLSIVPMIPGTPFREVATILQPSIALTAHNVFTFINSSFTIALHRRAGEKPFVLKGQMMWLPHCYHLLFIGSPRLMSLVDFKELQLFLCDVPIFDVTRELVLLNQQRITEIEVARKLDEATVELKKVSREVEEQKLRTEGLLHQMIPYKIASQLTAGQNVPAEKFESCTMLFGDIITFTEIVLKCPADDIVNMLNDIYHRFDTRTDAHEVYKVETIGDAYMAVTGVPEAQEDHAERMADFAMDMLEEACFVISPATGKSLKIRVGMHSGGVVAGVIGKKRPRYDIYGDTVNTASRMESYSAGGRIHISVTTFNLLYPYGYKFRARGDIVVKGKGLMKTYFLLGHSQRPMLEPTDAFTDLPMVVNPDSQDRQAKKPKCSIGSPIQKLEIVNIDHSGSPYAIYSSDEIDSYQLLPAQSPEMGFDDPLSMFRGGWRPKRRVSQAPAPNIPVIHSDTNLNTSAVPAPRSHARLSPPTSPPHHTSLTTHLHCSLHRVGLAIEDKVGGGTGDGTQDTSCGQDRMMHCYPRRDRVNGPVSGRTDPHVAWTGLGSAMPCAVSPHLHGKTHSETQCQAEKCDSTTQSCSVCWNSLPAPAPGSDTTPALGITAVGICESTGGFRGVRQLDRELDMVTGTSGGQLSRPQQVRTLAEAEGVATGQHPVQCTEQSSADTTLPASFTPHSLHHTTADHEVEKDESNLSETSKLCERIPSVPQLQNCSVGQPGWADRGGSVQADPDRVTPGVGQHCYAPRQARTQLTPLSPQSPPYSCLQHPFVKPPSSLLPSPDSNYSCCSGQVNEGKKCVGQVNEGKKCVGQVSGGIQCVGQVSTGRPTDHRGHPVESCPCSMQ